MFAFILWFAILQGDGQFATFSATYATEVECTAAMAEAKKVDMSDIDPQAIMKHIECVKINADPKKAEIPTFK